MSIRLLEIGGNYKRSIAWDVYNSIKVKGGIVHDMRNMPIPGIEDSVYDGVYNEHFLEHLTKEHGISFLQEMYRVMRPGAVIRIVWPSMDFVDMLNSKENYESHPFVVMYNRYIIDREKPFNHFYYKSIASVDQINNLSKQQKVAFRLLHQEGEHKHLWYKQELINCLISLGFKNVEEHFYRSSRLEQFNNVDRDDLMRSLHSTVVEAIK